jgi:hypothetical protein
MFVAVDPKPGAFAGVCTDGKPCAGLGVTVSF